MSLLSTFAILFETDAKKATKETEELSDALDDVESSAGGASGGVDNTTQSYNDNSSSAGALTKSMVGLIATFVTFDAIASKVFDTASGVDTLGKLSQTIGLNIVELDAWGVAAARNGGSAEAFRGTVESLQNSLQDISITGGGEIINTLAMIGVQATDSGGKIKSAFDVLPEIAKAFSKMSTEQSFAFGKRLGLDQGTILTLQQSRYEIDKLVERQKMLGAVTKEGYEAAATFNDQWDDTKRAFNSLWLSSNNTILPLFESILKGFESIALFVRNNSALVEGFFFGVAGVITAVYLPAIIAAAAATLIAIGPFVLIGAAITAAGVAIAVLYEDIKSWVDGSKSAIGELLGTFEDLKTKVKGIFDDIGSFFDFSGDVEVSGAGGSGLAPSNNSAALATIASYSATNLNHGGSTVNQRTQQNNVTVGGSTIDARGMSGSQARSAINASMKESVEMALGQLADGVER
jgi:hypothetical protein